jgi:hypothetical protein
LLVIFYSFRSFDLQGAVARSQNLACRDDLEALAQGVLRSDKWSIEVWQGARMVARIKRGNTPLNAGDPHSL